jgi:Glycosyltransferases involved in cell wall biogenesis
MEAPKLPVMPKPSLALVMMVKNEEKRITVSYDSVLGIVDSFVILDTGSQDKTIEITREYCTKHNITLHLLEAPFVDFSTSRNVLLDYADDKADYMVLLDCNDELRDGHLLRKFVNSYTETATAFSVTQNWWTGASLETYFNIRLIKTKNQWRYKGVVHEHITCPDRDKNLGKVPDIVIFQDRTKDDDKSFKRFSRDKVLLYNEWQRDPHEPRTLFYLGQTCGCLHHRDDAYKYYKLRTKEAGFREEIFQAFYRLGTLSWEMGHDWEETSHWFIKAFDFSAKIYKKPRIEPLISLVHYYKNTFNWQTAFMFLKRACELPFPDDAILFVEQRSYDYLRWHLMGIVAQHVGEKEMGKVSCVRAIRMENLEVDKTNLKIYVDNELEYEEILKACDSDRTKNPKRPDHPEHIVSLAREAILKKNGPPQPPVQPSPPPSSVAPPQISAKDKLKNVLAMKRNMRKKK